MDSKKKLQISVIIGAMALLLVLALVVGILLMPNSTTVTPSTSDKEQVTAPVNVQKYDITGRIFSADGKPMANTKFSIDLGPTDFTTDENGFFILKNLPVGQYMLSGYDSEGNRIGSTLVQLSTDGAFSIGSYSFEVGEVVTLCFDGEKFFAVIVKEKEDNNGSNDNQNDDTSDDKKEEIEIPVVDETYTNFSWMKDIPREYGAYNLDYYWNRDLLDGVLADEEFEYFDTFIVAGNNPEIMKKSVEAVVKDGKKVWLSVYNLLHNGLENKSENLKGNWREILDEYCAMFKVIAGDLFQGVYFDEPSHHMTSMDYTRVTQYIRETFNCRVWSIHASPAYLTPYYNNRDIVGYRPGRFDPMIINAKNHAYTTDVGWWKYGGIRWYGYSDVSYKEFEKAMTMLDPNTRKWLVPVFGAYDWRHEEQDCLDVQYFMLNMQKDMEGFGGIMLYSMWHGSAYDACAEITYEKYSKEHGNGRLTDADYLREDGKYVYKKSTGEHIKVNADGKYEYTITIDEVEHEAYMMLNEKNTEDYWYKNDEGVFVEFEEDRPQKDKLSRVVYIVNNNSPCGPSTDHFVEGYGAYFIYDKLPDGSVRWPRVKKYIDIMGKGIQNGTSWGDILKEMETVYKPDFTPYIKNDFEVEDT